MKVGHETPVNATAARVMARGEHFEFRGLETEVCSATPLPIRDVPQNCEDLAGQAFGRLRVVGLSADVNRRWVCRCACGNYVLRTAKTIKQKLPEGACQQCQLLALAKCQEYARRTGKFLEKRDFM